MALLSFNLHYPDSQVIIEMPGHNEDGRITDSRITSYRPGAPMNDYPYTGGIYLAPTLISKFSPSKIQIMADNYTNEGIVITYLYNFDMIIDSLWYIDVHNPFIVEVGNGRVTSPTAYLDCIRIQKMNPLHYRDQDLRLFFMMSDNFVTETDAANLFWVIDPQVVDYYDEMVDIYYPEAGTGSETDPGTDPGTNPPGTGD
jgi:hypothetical protein